MINRKERLHRLMVAKHAGSHRQLRVLIAYVMGILDRDPEAFPEVAGVRR
jgi:hypothetical protein